MIPAVTARQMRKIDEVTIRDFIPGIELMENAGAGVAEELLGYFKPAKTTRITVVWQAPS